MQEIHYIITDPCGLHARPAGELVRLVQGYQSQVRMLRGERSCDVKNVLSLMGLGVRQGETVAVQATGADEAECAAAIEAFLKARV